MVKPGELFPSVSSNVQVTIIFYLWMFGLLAASNVAGIRNQYGAINPVILFSLGFLGLGFLAFREANNFQQLKKVMGMDVVIPGFGILSTFMGIGIGFVVYTLWTRSLMSVANTGQIASIAQPFYNPYMASATGFALGSAVMMVLFIQAFIAIFEEAYKMGIFKNLANSMHYYTRKYSFLPNVPVSVILATALVITILLWGLWHYFSWDGLTAASVAMSFTYGIIFVAGYLILAVTNIVPIREVANKDVAKLLSGFVIYPNIGTHFSWNVLVTENGYGMSSQSLIIAGVGITFTSIVIMYLTRKYLG